MIWTICKKELRFNFLNLRIPLILIVSMAFAAVSTVISCKHFEQRLKDYQTRYTYHKNIVDFALYADRSPNPLSIFCSGVFFKSPVSVESIKIPYFGSETKVTEHPTDNILFDQIQHPDMYLVIAIVTGLGAILFGFDSICGEKQRGTLKLALSNDVPRYKHLVGKYLAGALGLSAIVLVVWLVSLTIVTQNPSIQLKANDFALLGLMCVTSFVYVILILMVAILISSMSHSAWGALVVSVTFWIVSCLFVPPVGPMAAKMISKTPLYQQLVLSKHSLLKQESQKALKKNDEKVKHIENAIQHHEIAWESIKTDSDRWSKLNEKLISDYQRKVAGQADLSRLICSVSPPLVFQFALSELCGTSIASQRYFEEQSKDWASAYTTNIVKKYWDATADSFQQAYQEIISPVSQPVVKQFSIAERLSHSLGHLAYMVILAIVCFSVTFVRFVRYDVR